VGGDAALIYLISILLPFTGLYLVGKFVVLAVLYVAVLFLLGEIGEEDKRRIRRILRRT